MGSDLETEFQFEISILSNFMDIYSELYCNLGKIRIIGRIRALKLITAENRIYSITLINRNK